MSRTEARELAFKTIYSKFFNKEADLDEKTDNINDLKFTNHILSEFAKNYQEINDLISSHLKGYTIERLYKVDLAILILAVIELNYIKENPKQVIINEAVELAKKFSTEKSPKFINGVLADIFNDKK